MATKDASLLYVVAIAPPNFICFGHLETFAVLVDYESPFVGLFDFVMNTLGELSSYLFENGLANKVPDFL